MRAGSAVPAETWRGEAAPAGGSCGEPHLRGAGAAAGELGRGCAALGKASEAPAPERREGTRAGRSPAPAPGRGRRGPRAEDRPLWSGPWLGGSERGRSRGIRGSGAGSGGPDPGRRRPREAGPPCPRLLGRQRRGREGRRGGRGSPQMGAWDPRAEGGAEPRGGGGAGGGGSGGSCQGGPRL